MGTTALCNRFLNQQLASRVAQRLKSFCRQVKKFSLRKKIEEIIKLNYHNFIVIIQTLFSDECFAQKKKLEDENQAFNLQKFLRIFLKFSTILETDSKGESSRPCAKAQACARQ